MGENKRIRKALQGHYKALAVHHDKIAEELRKPNPDTGLIHKWQNTISNIEAVVARLERRLKGK
jgi:hypothetical protein